MEYVLSLPLNGVLIFCADQKGAVEVADLVLQKRKDIKYVEYGFLAHGKYRIRDFQTKAGVNTFILGENSFPIRIHLPGKHLVQDAVAAIALVEQIYETEKSKTFEESEWNSIVEALATFRGSKRRSEIIGEYEKILIMDDYGHHPTAIKTTIEGIKKFWPHRRLVVDFMSHTYTRTIALQDDFVSSLDNADSILLHKIYASAREQPVSGFSGKTLYEKLCEHRPELFPIDLEKDNREKIVSGFSGKTLYEKLCEHRPELFPIDLEKDNREKIIACYKNKTREDKKGFIAYADEPLEALNPLTNLLQPGDIFLTLGAGDNWKLAKALAERLDKNLQHQSN